jgi:hypothetical protein
MLVLHDTYYMFHFHACTRVYIREASDNISLSSYLDMFALIPQMYLRYFNQ